MTAIHLARIPNIVQGAGALEELGSTLAAYLPQGSAILLVADPGLSPSGVIDLAAAALQGGGYGVICHQAIRLVARHLARAIEAPADLEARAGLQWAATLAGIGIDNCGTAIAHNIGHALASLRPENEAMRRSNRRPVADAYLTTFATAVLAAS